MQLIVSGCSYQDLFRSCLDPKTTMCVGQSGRSNHWLAQSVIWALTTHPVKDPMVLVSWTSIDRRDILLDRQRNLRHRQISFERYSLPEYFTGQFSFRQFQWYSLLDQVAWNPDRSTGLLSLTNLRPDIDSAWPLELLSGLYYQWIHTELSGWELFLTSVLSLQNYCDLHHVPYLFMPWQDLHHSTTELTGLTGQSTDNLIEDYGCLSLRRDLFPELDYLYHQIKWENWLFYPSRGSAYGGIADFCIDRGLFGQEGDSHHPRLEGYRAFYRDVIRPRLGAYGALGIQ